MRYRATRWSAVGGGGVALAASHGWVGLLGVAVILGICYLAAYALIRELKGRDFSRAKITTPILTIEASWPDKAESSPLRLEPDVALPEISSVGESEATADPASAAPPSREYHTEIRLEMLSTLDYYKPSRLVRKRPMTLP